MYELAIWLIGQISKQKLLNIIWKIFRKVFKQLYREILNDVKAAELALPDATGAEKAAWVIERFYRNHNELSEWRWIANILVEVAVGELKASDDAAKYSEFKTRLSEITR